MWTMITDDLVIEAKPEINFVKEKGGNPFGGDSFVGGA